MSADARAGREALAETLAGRGITCPRVLRAIASVPREEFVPESLRERAFDDDALGLEHGQSISQPYVVALMTEALGLVGGERVLELGTGSGYQAAVLEAMGAGVVSIERIAALAESARRRLEDLGYAVTVHVGDGTAGWPAGGPYDHVLITAAAPDVPAPLWDQLKPGGSIVAPVGPADVQELIVAGRSPDGTLTRRRLCHCRFVKLLGAHAWQQE